MKVQKMGESAQIVSFILRSHLTRSVIHILVPLFISNIGQGTKIELVIELWKRKMLFECLQELLFVHSVTTLSRW